MEDTGLRWYGRKNVPESFEIKVSDVLAVDSGHLVSHQILSRTEFVRELNS